MFNCCIILNSASNDTILLNRLQVVTWTTTFSYSSPCLPPIHLLVYHLRVLLVRVMVEQTFLTLPTDSPSACAFFFTSYFFGEGRWMCINLTTQVYFSLGILFLKNIDVVIFRLSFSFIHQLTAKFTAIVLPKNMQNVTYKRYCTLLLTFV